MGNLTTATVRKLAKPGRYGDGGGLHLLISKGGSRSWVQRVRINGKRRDKGLGGFPAVSLAAARKTADRNRVAIADGRDPFSNQAKARDVILERASTTPTFSEAAQQVHDLKAGGWRSDKYTERWLGTLAVHVLPTLGDVPIDQITRAELVEVLAPLCRSKPETARKTKQRLKAIFTWAVASDFIARNPVDDALQELLPKVTVSVQHRPALAYADVPGAIDVIRRSQGLRESKLALAFTILTAARGGEARGATWEEIDLDAGLWTIPAERMKSSRSHVVPLSFQARVVLDEAKAAVAKRRKRKPDYNPNGLVFPHPSGKPLSENALMLRVKKAQLGCTVHGFRSSFRDWAQEQSGASWATIELSLAHRAGTTVEQAYFRSDLIDQRRTLMQAWADFADPTPF